MRYADENPTWALDFRPPLSSPSDSLPQPALVNSFYSPAGFPSSSYRRGGATASRFYSSRRQFSGEPSAERDDRKEGTEGSSEGDTVDFPTFANIDPNSVNRDKAPIEEVRCDYRALGTLLLFRFSCNGETCHTRTWQGTSSIALSFFVGASSHSTSR